jgi:hypothetical protein
MAAKVEKESAKRRKGSKTLETRMERTYRTHRGEIKKMFHISRSSAEACIDIETLVAQLEGEGMHCRLFLHPAESERRRHAARVACLQELAERHGSHSSARWQQKLQAFDAPPAKPSHPVLAACITERHITVNVFGAVSSASANSFDECMENISWMESRMNNLQCESEFDPNDTPRGLSSFMRMKVEDD